MTNLSFSEITNGKTIWQADGRGPRPEHLTYRESFRATYQGPYTKGRLLAWDALTSNRPGMIGNDPGRGFDLTMHAGEAVAGSYTTRDLASAPHGYDYQPHYREWQADHNLHPNLFLPGRTALWHGVRFDLLKLGDRLLGTAGCIIQDWRGIEFETMEKYGNTAMSEYSGGGFVMFNKNAMFPRMARFLNNFQAKGLFSQPKVPNAAPLYVMFARVKGFLKTGLLYIDPDVPHELACHWTPDGCQISFWLDGQQVMAVEQGKLAIPMGTKTGGRVHFSRCGFHLDCWQDNGAGGVDVQGAAGHPDIDQVFSVESLELRQV